MNFRWGWLGKGNKQKERYSSDNDKNPKHCCRSWSEVVKDSSVDSGKATVSATGHSHSNVIVPAAISLRKQMVKSTILDPTATYADEQAAALHAEAQKMPLLKKSKADNKGWTEHKSRKTIKRERSKKRKFNSPLISTEGC